MMAKPKPAPVPGADTVTDRAVAMIRYLMAAGDLDQTAVGRRIGVDQAFVSMLLGGKRNARFDVVHGLVVGFRVDPRYFWDKRAGAPAEYLSQDPPFPAWREFLQSPAGRGIDDAERRALASIDLAEYEPTADFYEAVLYALGRKCRRVEAVRSEPAALESPDATRAMLAGVKGPPRVVVDVPALQAPDDDEPELVPVPRRKAEHVEYGDAEVIDITARVRERAGPKREHLVKPAVAWLGRMKRQDPSVPYADEEIERALREVGKSGGKRGAGK